MRRVRAVLRIVAVLLALAGGGLYLASYFRGGCLLLGALLAWGFERRLALGADFGARVRALARRAAVPAAGIAAALLIGAAIMALTGYSPLASYEALFYGGFVRNWHISVLNAVPLVFTGLAIAFGFHGGLFNIGAEGQYLVGVMAATWLGIGMGLPPLVGMALIFLVGALAGAATNLVPALLKVKTGAHEVVTTMMFAYAIRTLAPIFIRAHGGDPANTAHPYVTDAVAEGVWLPLFKDFLPEANYRLHVGILLAVACAFLVHFVLTRTDLGYRIRAVGANATAARTQGISVAWITTLSLLGSGALAACAGITQVLGLDHRMFQNLDAGYGWNGISIALLARNHPLAIPFTALLWGVLDAGGQYMARTVQTPNAIIEIVKGILLFLLLAEVIYEKFGTILRDRLKGLLDRKREVRS
ncbi:MAG TPA: ABC transporter permease [Holophaga sp.]|nr:ABC transporter permease [Holophaga sp.]HPS68730.1 ABC transporter permease [Holophaga sp.]